MSSKYNTVDEVVWFISVTKEPDWDMSRFEHEYHVKHAEMTAQGAKYNPALRSYTQLAHLEIQHREDKQPEWTCITRLTWANTDILWSGFKNAQYRETAGKHIFCRLDQVGLIAKEVGGFEGVVDKSLSKVQAIVFHRRNPADDEVTEDWFQKRLTSAQTTLGKDHTLCSYKLFTDVTPKDTAAFFLNTQFSGGSWLKYSAVEELEFVTKEEAADFLRGHQRFVEDTPQLSPPQIVIGDRITVV